MGVSTVNGPGGAAARCFSSHLRGFSDDWNIAVVITDAWKSRWKMATDIRVGRTCNHCCFRGSRNCRAEPDYPCKGKMPSSDYCI